MAITHTVRRQGNVISGHIVESTVNTTIDETVSCPAGHFFVLLALSAYVDDTGAGQVSNLSMREAAGDLPLATISARQASAPRHIGLERTAPWVTDVGEDVKMHVEIAGTGAGPTHLCYVLAAVPKGTPPAEWPGR